MNREECGTNFPRRNDVKDVTGCLKHRGHHDEHICRNNKGELVAWHNDEDCTCGCWQEDDGHPCIVYWKITEAEYLDYLTQQNKKACGN